MPVGSASRVPWLRVCAQTSAETVFLSKRQLNTLESISIGHCLCGSTSTAFVAHLSWSFDEPYQSDRISPKVPLQDLSRQWSFLVLVIVTQSSQAYQQTRSLGYSESRTKRHGLLWKKKENEITLHLSSKNFTSYLWNSAASIRSRLWPIAISKGLYPVSYTHLTLPTSDLV